MTDTLAPARLRAFGLVPIVARTQRVALWVALSFVIFAAASAWVPWQQSVRGAGRVIAYAPLDRRQTVQAPIAGRLDHFHVREGTLVKRGQPLAEIRDNDPQLVKRLDEQRQALLSKLASYEEQVVQLEAQANSLREAREGGIEGAQAKFRAAEQKLSVERQKLEASQAALETAQVQLDRVRSLASQGLSATRDVELALLAQTKARTERASAAAALDGARADVQAATAYLRATRAETDAKIQEVLSKLGSARSDVASTRGSLTQIDVKISRQNAQQVTAPRDGVVLRLLAAAGGVQVKPGEPLLELVPDAGQQAVEIWVDGNDAPLISAGREVRLQFEGWPAVQFAGWPSVAVGTFGGEVAFVDSHGDDAGSFRVVIVSREGGEPWPPPRYLRQGARVKGWVLLNEVRLGYELWRQFNGFPPVVDPPDKPRKQSSPKGSNKTSALLRASLEREASA